MNKKLIAALAISMMSVATFAAKIDTTLHRMMAYEKFIPAKITLQNGKSIRVAQANVFLKNSTLLYKSGSSIKQAAMQTVKYVDFADRRYERLDTLLAYEVDTIGKNRLMCAPQLDLEALRRTYMNNRVIDSFSLSDVVSVTSSELMNEGDIEFPIFNQYFFIINGKVVRCGDRYTSRVVAKDKRRLYTDFVNRDRFDWEDPQSLIGLLYVLTK